MALQVWLPLNGDLHNQGLSDVVVTNNGATVDNNGKIGKCYYFNSSSHIRISMPSDMTTILNSTVCAWIKSKSSTLALGGISHDSSADQAGCTLYTSGWQISGAGGWKYVSAGSIANTNVWHHVCCTIDNTTVTTYLNGIQIASATLSSLGVTATNITSANFIEIGCDHPGGDEYLTGYVNDFRIYDHCLSAKEVEEIAKGLVLHYPLNNNGLGNENLILTSNKIISGGNGNGITRTYLEDGSIKIIANAGNSNYASIGFPKNSNDNVGAKLSIGDIYTISCDIKVESGTKLPTLFINSGNAYKQLQGEIKLNQWIKAYYTSTWNDPGTGYGNISLHFGFSSAIGTYYIKNLKLEKGSNFTPWTPAPSDLNINSSIIYDTSGYNNNGTIIGSLQTITPSPRYNCATKFTNGQYIRINNRPATCMPKDAITVNLWLYITSWSNPISCTEGGGWNFESSNNNIRFPIYISGVGYKVAQSSITPASMQNAWHMLTGTMDKDNIKIYYDGEEVGTIINGSTNGIGYANNYIFIGAEASGDTTTPADSSYTGNLSDIRIYATALTPNQIKELYNTSMSIDNQGNIHARELVEI